MSGDETNQETKTSVHFVRVASRPGGGIYYKRGRTLRVRAVATTCGLKKVLRINRVKLYTLRSAGYYISKLTSKLCAALLFVIKCIFILTMFYVSL